MTALNLNIRKLQELPVINIMASLILLVIMFLDMILYVLLILTVRMVYLEAQQLLKFPLIRAADVLIV